METLRPKQKASAKRHKFITDDLTELYCATDLDDVSSELAALRQTDLGASLVKLENHVMLNEQEWLDLMRESTDVAQLKTLFWHVYPNTEKFMLYRWVFRTFLLPYPWNRFSPRMAEVLYADPSFTTDERDLWILMCLGNHTVPLSRFGLQLDTSFYNRVFQASFLPGDEAPNAKAAFAQECGGSSNRFPAIIAGSDYFNQVYTAMHGKPMFHPNDVDIFCTMDTESDFAVHKRPRDVKHNYKSIFSYTFEGRKIQLICMKNVHLSSIPDRFDFDAIQGHYNCWTGECIVRPSMIYACITQKVTFIYRTMRPTRYNKYVDRGFTIDKNMRSKHEKNIIEWYLRDVPTFMLWDYKKSTEQGVQTNVLEGELSIPSLPGMTDLPPRFTLLVYALCIEKFQLIGLRKYDYPFLKVYRSHWIDVLQRTYPRQKNIWPQAMIDVDAEGIFTYLPLEMYHNFKGQERKQGWKLVEIGINTFEQFKMIYDAPESRKRKIRHLVYPRKYLLSHHVVRDIVPVCTSSVQSLSNA